MSSLWSKSQNMGIGCAAMSLGELRSDKFMKRPNYKNEICEYLREISDYSSESVESTVNHLNSIISSGCNAAYCIKCVSDTSLESDQKIHYRAVVCGVLMLQHGVTAVQDISVQQELKNMGINVPYEPI